ncbi:MULTISPECIES: hypothetical protein [unclassified Streptomyces]|uniref:hypothetical protein n=1 Tax=Streptomycetaceae TaxID=2062 RepID=UPI002E777AFF|nr:MULTISPECIES: hypothetical protein [unclassified Streptomyces]MED7951226.1 hypothetical protein [Streptomyces sp. BE303]MEE1826413.1 hypothetical protein [Streptomyces sp. BE20]
MRSALRRAHRRLLLRRWARRSGRYLADGMIWLGLAMAPLTSPSALPGARRPEPVLPPPGVPDWHPERAGAEAAPLSRNEAELWAQLER